MIYIYENIVKLYSCGLRVRAFA